MASLTSLTSVRFRVETDDENVENRSAFGEAMDESIRIPAATCLTQSGQQSDCFAPLHTDNYFQLQSVTSHLAIDFTITQLP